MSTTANVIGIIGGLISMAWLIVMTILITASAAWATFLWWQSERADRHRPMRTSPRTPYQMPVYPHWINTEGDTQ